MKNSRNAANVEAAVEMLLDEIDAALDEVNDAGATAFTAGDYKGVDAARDQAGKLRRFREEAAGLRKAWQTEVRGSKGKSRSRKTAKTARRDFGKLPHGVRTPQPAFRVPVLRTLVEIGGSGSTSEVLERVGRAMQDVLNDVDREPLPSNPRELRWRNTAQWTRAALVQEGLMRNDSPRGTWAITEAGERYLAREQERTGKQTSS